MIKVNQKNRILYQILLFFIILWLPLFILDILSVKSRYYNLTTIFMNLYFIISLIISTYLSYFLLKGNEVHTQKKSISINKVYYIKIIKKVIFIASILSIIGILSLIFDRLFIKGINYSLGARQARYQWMNLNSSTSFFGAIGNLCVPFTYISLFCSYFYFEYLTNYYKWIGIITGVFIPLFHAFLNGGRSNLLLLICYTFSLAILRKMSKKSMVPKFKLKRITVIFFILIFLVYIFSIFYESLQFNNLGFKSYVDLLINTLGGMNNNSSNDLIVNNIIMMFSYLYHGKWTTGIILSVSSLDRYGFYSFVGVDSILSRFGLNLPLKHNISLLNGAFLNVPGTLFYDFGWVGFLIFPIIIGFFFAVTIHKVINKKNLSLSFFIVFITVFMFIFCTPIIPVFNLAYFNFIIFAIVITEIYLKIKYKNFKWVKEL